MGFEVLKEAVQKQFEKMIARGKLFRTEVESDKLWETYLDSFPEGTNEVFRERREYDCSCCRSFIKGCGNVVAVVPPKFQIVSLWDVKVEEPYQTVVDALAKLVKGKPIYMPFFRTDPVLGVDRNIEINDKGKPMTWQHFFFRLPANFVCKHNIGTVVGDIQTAAKVFERGLTELRADDIETVLELIDANSLYRGEEFKGVLESFLGLMQTYNKLRTKKAKNAFVWHGSSLGALARFRNTAMGTLIQNLAEDMPLDEAVTKYEKIMAPTNYKRPKAIITKSMIAKAQAKVEELGLTPALDRRYATFDDITVNNVLFADREARRKMSKNVFEELIEEVPEDPKKYSKVEEVTINDFIEKIMPKAKSIELQVENRHEPNLMSLIAPVNDDVERLFKWHNNFSWEYKGGVADSMMKERVKAAGGNIDAILRFSIQWNDIPNGDNNQNDFDAHCKEPGGNHIWFQTKGYRHESSGMLDVDIIHPGNQVAVENITWVDPRLMREGTYHMYVHNYSHNGGTSGFTAEIEYGGVIHTFVYNRELRQGEKVTVAKVVYSKANGITFKEALPSTMASREIWGLHTNRFHRVQTIMMSPNHWDERQTGNRHWFFMLENCLNPTKARGYYNEFLRQDLTEHRKVFEVLGSKMRAEPSDEQLSGLGFSHTKRNSILCRVTGKTTRVIRIQF